MEQRKRKSRLADIGEKRGGVRTSGRRSQCIMSALNHKQHTMGLWGEPKNTIDTQLLATKKSD
ncbi:MAG: hypothetical protein WCJ92_07765 [Alphaproteobacteria bacterium]